MTFIGPVAPPSQATGGLPVELWASGNSNFDSETLIAYELGFRTQVSPRLSLDAALFYNDYDRLRTIDLAPGPPELELIPAPRLVLRGTAGNHLEGETYGFELAADYRPYDWWRLQAAYSFLDMRLRPKAGNADPAPRLAEGESFSHTFALGSAMDLSDTLEFDLQLRHASNLSAFDIPSYTTLDVRLGWQPRKNLHVSLIGRNLVDSPHREFGGFLFATGGYEVAHEYYLMAEWRF